MMIEYPIDFSRAWKAYGAPPADPKKTAFKAWNKSEKERPDINTIVLCIQAYLRDLVKQNQGRPVHQHIRRAHFSTWLNQNRWEGFLPVVEAQTQQNTAINDATRLQWNGKASKLIQQLGNPAIFDAWFGGTEFSEGPPATITFQSPFKAKWVRENFINQIHRALGEVTIREG